MQEHKNKLSSITELIGPDVWIKGVVCICCRMSSMYIKCIFKQVNNSIYVTKIFSSVLSIFLMFFMQMNAQVLYTTGRKKQ